MCALCFHSVIEGFALGWWMGRKERGGRGGKGERGKGKGGGVRIILTKINSCSFIYFLFLFFLGMLTDFSDLILVFIAIIAHKAVAAFALGTSMAKVRVSFFSFFLPLSILTLFFFLPLSFSISFLRLRWKHSDMWQCQAFSPSPLPWECSLLFLFWPLLTPMTLFLTPLHLLLRFKNFLFCLPLH